MIQQWLASLTGGGMWATIVGGVATLLGILTVIWRALRKREKSYLSGAIYWIVGRYLRRSVQLIVNARRYYQRVLTSSNSEFLAVPGEPEVLIRTDDSFVSLSLDGSRYGQTRYSEETVVEAGPRIRIVGDPGSGKSSLVKRILRDECRRGVVSPTHARLPIFIDLKHFSPPARFTSDSQIQTWAMKQICERVTAVDGYKMEELFDSAAHDGGLLLLLDGLDEVATDQFVRTVTAIKIISRRLAELGSKSVVIVTMRTHFHQQTHELLDDHFPRTLHVKNFSSSDIYTFLAKWPHFGPEPIVQINRVYAELAAKPNVLEMCRNPLVLAMYVANYQQVTVADLPDTRTEFYSKVARELLVKRRSRQLNSRTARTTLERQRSQVLQKLALDNLLDATSPANSIPIGAAIEAVRVVTKAKNEISAELTFNEIANETGLLSEDVPGESIRFIHLTFCEYFAALAAIDNGQSGVRNLIDAHLALEKSSDPAERSRLIEVVPFAIALLQGLSERRQLLELIEHAGSIELLGRCLLETQDYEHAVWVKYDGLEFAQLNLSGSYQWDSVWAARLQLFTAVCADVNECARYSDAVIRPTHTTVDLLRGLIDDDSDRLLQLFGLYVAENPAAALELADKTGLDMIRDHSDLLVDSCSVPPFLSLAIEKGLTDTSGHWAAIVGEAALRYPIVMERLNSLNAPISKLLTRGGRESSASPSRVGAYTPDLSSVKVDIDLAAFPMLAIVQAAPTFGFGSGRDRVRVWGLSLVGILGAVVAGAGLIAFDSVPFLPLACYIAGAAYLTFAILAPLELRRVERRLRLIMSGDSTRLPDSVLPISIVAPKLQAVSFLAILLILVRRGRPPFDHRRLTIDESTTRRLRATIPGRHNRLGGEDLRVEINALPISQRYSVKILRGDGDDVAFVQAVWRSREIPAIQFSEEFSVVGGEYDPSR